MTNREVLVRLRMDPTAFIAGSQAAKAAVRDLHNEIDKSNDRTAWLAQGILALAPAAVRLGAGAVPAISGIATQLTVAVAAAGTAALAFNGIGDALGALNDYQLDPTAENLKQLNQAMEKIGPNGRELVEVLDRLGPVFEGLSNSARAEMFPGVIRGLEDFMSLAPRFNTIVQEMGSGLGQLAAEGGAGLSSARFDDFFTYMETEAKPILIEMGRTMGNFADGLLNMLVAFHPLSADFSSGLLDMSRSFVAWSDSLESSEGFQSFVDYVREAGPQTLDFLGSLVMALVALATAMAPLGEISVKALTEAADAIAALAATPLGPIALGFMTLTAAWGRLNALAAITGSGVMSKAAGGIVGNLKGIATGVGPAVAGMSTLGTSALVAGANTEKMAAANTKATGALSTFGKAALPVAGQIGLLAFALSDYDDKLGLANTSTLALMGSMFGLPGLIGGAIVGGFLDMRAAGDEATATIDGLMTTANSGDLEAFADELAQANAELAAFKQDDFVWLGDKLGNLIGKDSRIDEKTKQIAAAEQAARKAASQVARLEAAQANAARGDAYTAAMKRAEDAVIDFSEAVAKLDAVLSRRSKMRDYEAAIDDFTDSLKDNGRTFDINTDKGRKNQAALDNIANTTIRVAENLKGAAKQRFLTRAIADLEAMGGKFKIPKSQIDILIARLEKANKSEVNPVIKVNALPAFATFRQVDQYMSALDGKTATTYVNTVRTVTGPKGAAIFGSADGSTVPDSGKGYADRFLYMLADREEVISNRRGQADRYRAPLKAINADMPPAVIKAMLAGGGTTGGKTPQEKAEEERERAKDRADKAKAAAAERRQREEEKRQRKLDAQRRADLLASNLRDEQEQQRLEIEDAKRRLRSAQKANRPRGEILDAKLALKTERSEKREADDQRQMEQRQEEEDRRIEAEEARAEHEARMTEALIEGQERAAEQLIEAAEAQQDSAKAVMENWQQAMDRTGSAATAGFRSDIFAQQQHGMWSGSAPGQAGWRGALGGDIAGLTQRSGVITQLSGLGLRGTALEALLGEGTDTQIQKMIDDGDIQDFAQMFAQREALQGAVSGQAGQAAYGAEFAAASAAVATLGSQILMLQAQLAAISAQRPITVYESLSAQATAAEVARLQSLMGSA